jgi:hypothetical protein
LAHGADHTIGGSRSAAGRVRGESAVADAVGQGPAVARAGDGRVDAGGVGLVGAGADVQASGE